MATQGIIIAVKGIDEAISKLKDIASNKLKNVEQGIKKAGFYVQAEVQASIAGQRAETRSVDTGRFLNSVKTTFPEPYTATVETNVVYATHLEFGTSKLQPRSHFRNTANRNKDKVKDIIKQEVSK